MDEGGSARRKGGYRRGDDSRQRIVEAALDVFGHAGYDGATTRTLAAAAGVNLAAIGYYFGGKEGLYRAVAEHIVAEIAARQAPMVARVHAALGTGEPSGDAARTLLLDVLDSLAAMLIGSAEAERWARFVIREQMDPSPAFDVIYDGFMRGLHGLCCRLVGRLRGRPADDAEVVIVTTTLFGQILVFRAARATAQRALGWTAYTPERTAAIRAVIRRQVAAILDSQAEATS
ncbi:MAG: CerR family C-terminal domain-containing protein [Alphaproteobacteria bacterium]